MLSLSQIETDLKDALKARDSLRADTLRGLKSRIQKEQTAPGRSETSAHTEGAFLTETEITALVRSEVKRRKEAAMAFEQGGRSELSAKELQEAEILSKYLPAQMSEEKLVELINKTVTEMAAGPSDFGKIMGKLKAQTGDQADGAMLAKLLKEKLK